MKCPHDYILVDDGDQGSFYFCRNCAHREYNWRKVYYKGKDPMDKLYKELIHKLKKERK